MYKELKILSLFVYLIGFSVNAQLDDLSMLGINTESFLQNSGNYSDSENSESGDVDSMTNEKDLNQQDAYADDYGYTGGEDFNNPPIRKFSQEPLEYFGYSYFSNIKSTFVPLINVPVPPDYLIGPDDVIKIIRY